MCKVKNSAPLPPEAGYKLPVKTYADLRAMRPCYDPVERGLCASDWRGTALDVLRNDDIPPADRLWFALRPECISEYTLHEFAVWCGEQALALISNPDPRSVAGIEAKKRWLQGKISDKELTAAAKAAYAYASDTAAAAAAAASDTAAAAAAAATYAAAAHCPAAADSTAWQSPCAPLRTSAPARAAAAAAADVRRHQVQKLITLLLPTDPDRPLHMQTVQVKL